MKTYLIHWIHWSVVILFVQIMVVNGMDISTFGYQLQHVQTEKCIEAADSHAVNDIPRMHDCIENATLFSKLVILQGTLPDGKLLATQYLTSNTNDTLFKCLTTQEAPNPELLQYQACPNRSNHFRYFDWIFFRIYNYQNRFQIFHKDSGTCLGLTKNDTIKLKECSEADIMLHWQNFKEVSKRSTTTEQSTFAKTIGEQKFVYNTNHITHYFDSDAKTMYGVVLIVILLCVIVFAVIMCIARHYYQPIQTNVQGIPFYDGKVEKIDPNLNVAQQTQLLPFDPQWEFPYENLKLGDKLGDGAFGSVFKAEAREILENQEITTVAVKTVDSTTKEIEMCFEALVSELKILCHLGKHLNIVNLLGACTKSFVETRNLYVIIEYCEFGSLRDFLITHRNRFADKDTVNSNSNEPHTLKKVKNTGEIELITPSDIIVWGFQVASGMAYLAARNVLHGDLALRNVLLAENNVVKLCDFGLSKELDKVYSYNYKKCLKNALLPYKWMAIESIKCGLFSTHSDCWSFGIVLWELFSLGDTPYPGMEVDENFVKRLSSGYRMTKPDHAPSEIYDIMLQCWSENLGERPTFSDLVASLGGMVSQERVDHYNQLNSELQSQNTTKTFGTDYLSSMLGGEIQTSYNQLLAQHSDDGYLVPTCQKVKYRKTADENTVCEVTEEDGQHM